MNVITISVDSDYLVILSLILVTKIMVNLAHRHMVSELSQSIPNRNSWVKFYLLALRLRFLMVDTFKQSLSDYDGGFSCFFRIYVNL